jgi:hypothetical protein
MFCFLELILQFYELCIDFRLYNLWRLQDFRCDCVYLCGEYVWCKFDLKVGRLTFLEIDQSHWFTSKCWYFFLIYHQSNQKASFFVFQLFFFLSLRLTQSAIETTNKKKLNEYDLGYTSTFFFKYSGWVNSQFFINFRCFSSNTLIMIFFLSKKTKFCTISTIYFFFFNFYFCFSSASFEWNLFTFDFISAENY